ncbi:alpha/beta hydrolase family protein [Aspergillus alliaceus]|uniref:alpha/beta hydrolase family protein n=1 Tax=Petromyces alliaceus TaxID=209559 RepID=UPI0012A6F58C|nr:Alpha/Beta hydrolase protein [Aspergillus alliaceus]KAB8226932.1 Alpha/Beta hydrolase protein [Aspergillus alliaceus]
MLLQLSLCVGTLFILVTANASIPNVTITNSTTSIHQLSSDPEFAFALETFLSFSNGGGASTGEVLRAASQIIPGDYESFYTEFKFLADQIAHQATSVDATRFPVSARQAHLRAATYYRAADFFLHGNASDPRILTLWSAMLDNYDTAMKLLPEPPQKVELDGGRFKIPVYFYPAPKPSHANVTGGKGKRVPTVVVGTGYDGAQQDLYHAQGQEILARGWNLVTYEGPGQPQVRREQSIGFIPDWWSVITPIIDWLKDRDDVDIDRIALEGVSYGGQLAPLAASREHRLAAVIALDGWLDLRESILQKFTPQIRQVYQSGNATAFDAAIWAAYKLPGMSQFKWSLEQGLWAFDTTSPFEWLNKMGQAAVSQAVLDNITCPVFVASGEDDGLAPGQPEMMARMLGDKAHYHLFKTNVGAGEHCAIGAESQMALATLNWLDEVFENQTSHSS